MTCIEQWHWQVPIWGNIASQLIARVCWFLQALLLASLCSC